MGANSISCTATSPPNEPLDWLDYVKEVLLTKFPSAKYSENLNGCKQGLETTPRGFKTVTGLKITYGQSL